MVKGGRQHLHDALVKRALKAFQESALFEIRQELSQFPTRSRLLTNAGESSQSGIPNSNHELSIGCKNSDRRFTDLRHPLSSAANFLVRRRLGFSWPLPLIIVSLLSPSSRA